MVNQNFHSALDKYPDYCPSGFSEIIFKERYALTASENWFDACLRVSQQNILAENPEKRSLYEDKFYKVLVKNLFVPGGRIWYNSGRNNPQLLNCFLLRSELDSKEGWGELSKEMIITSMTGGGCGIDFSDVRPEGAEIAFQRGTCPGPVSLMELINGNGAPVRAGGSRRVALMFSLDLDHPDVETFLSYKLDQGKLPLANISVRSKNTTAFINAVKEDTTWELSWKGKYKKSISARHLWSTISHNAYYSAEPGFLNWELVEKENPIWYDPLGKLVSSNPCGEICMGSFDSCCLGHIVLHRFVTERQVIDWEGLGETIRLGVRFLDNVLDVNSYPLSEMKYVSSQIRRIGLGVTGLADLLIKLNIKYGSDDSLIFLDRLFKFISKQAYEASIMLAVEKGAFPRCIPSMHLEGGYIRRLPHKIRSLLSEHGIRNCALLTCAPTGTVSILSGNCSSGIEPIFAPAYERRFWKDDARQVEIVVHPLFKEFQEQGLSLESFVSSRDLTIKQHMEVQKIIQKHIDNSVSKTINIPENYPETEVSEIWLEYLPFLKGTTFYRENTRGYVDDKGQLHEPPLRPLSIAEALNKVELGVTSSEIDCNSGMCEI